jgi:hypothetical protein
MKTRFLLALLCTGFFNIAVIKAEEKIHGSNDLVKAIEKIAQESGEEKKPEQEPATKKTTETSNTDANKEQTCKK